MPASIDILYTAIGGAIGAALTQYVTHVRDRRAARALVIERVADVEEAFTTLRMTLLEDSSVSFESALAGKLAALESACLIAGMPRSVLKCYTASIKQYEGAHRVLRASKNMGEEVARTVNESMTQLRESSNRNNTIANLKTISESLHKLQEHVNAINDPAFTLHDLGLQELGRALWHPLTLQFRRPTLHYMQRIADTLDESGRELTLMLRETESLYRMTSRNLPNPEAVEGAAAADSLPTASEP